MYYRTCIILYIHVPYMYTVNTINVLLHFQVIKKKANNKRSYANTHQEKLYWTKQQKKEQQEQHHQQQQQQQSDETSKPKQPCKYYLNGYCIHGDTCQYSHDIKREKKKEICKFYLQDTCDKGDDCGFYHGRCNRGSVIVFYIHVHVHVHVHVVTMLQPCCNLVDGCHHIVAQIFTP